MAPRVTASKTIPVASHWDKQEQGMHVQRALPEDISSWLTLATEVEPLFGPLIGNPGFHNALHKNIGRGTAYCIRENDGPSGSRRI